MSFHIMEVHGVKTSAPAMTLDDSMATDTEGYLRASKRMRLEPPIRAASSPPAVVAVARAIKDESLQGESLPEAAIGAGVNSDEVPIKSGSETAMHHQYVTLRPAL